MRLSLRWAVSGVLLSALAGCGQQESIHSYRVPKAAVVYELNHVAGAKPPGSSAAAKPQRMIAAIVPHGSQGWFFKLTGDPEQVEKQADAFEKFLRSLVFEGDKDPKWTLPTGWRQLPGSQMRFATIQIDAGGDKPLDLSVTSLPRGEDDLTNYLLANINRWRGQLQQGPITAAALNDESERIEVGGATAYVVDIEGKAGDSPMSRAPFAGGAGSLPPLTQPQRPATTKTAEGPSLKYDVPEGWKAGRVSQLRKAAFEVSGDNQKVEITVIDLEPAAGEILPNINRWRGQVGLAPLSPAEVDAALKPISVGGTPGKYVVLEGQGKEGKPEMLLGVVVTRAGRPWFIKLLGDADLAAREKEHFEEFVKSLKIGAEEAGHGQ